MAHNGWHKISAGLKAVSYPAPMKFEKGITVQISIYTRINFMQCCVPLILETWILLKG